MGYSLSRKAEEDILGIYFDGIQHFGLMQADRYHRQLEEVFEFLAENPRVAQSEPKSHPQSGFTLFDRIWLFIS